MVLLDLQGMLHGRALAAADSAMSLSCVPESNVSQAFCDDDPDFSNVSVILCLR